MKFRDYLKDNKVAHWRDKYIDYEYLKNLIDNEYDINENSPPLPITIDSTFIDMSPTEQFNENEEDEYLEEDEDEEEEDDEVEENNQEIKETIVGDGNEEIEMETMDNLEDGNDIDGVIINNLNVTAGNRVKVKKGFNKGVKRLKKNITQLNNKLGKLTSNKKSNKNKNNNSNGSNEEIATQFEVPSSQIEIVASNNDNVKLNSANLFTPQENFQDAFVDQVNKVDAFFVERYRKTKAKCIELCNMIPFLSTNEQLRTIRNIEYVKQGFHDNYHYLESLEAFKEINIRGFLKSLEKYEKRNPLISAECKKYLDNTRLSTVNSPVRELSRRIKHLYARYFTGNDIKLASNQIKTNVEMERFEKYNLFTIGFLIGACLLLSAFAIFSYCYFYPTESPPIGSPMAWLLFRISLLPILLGTLFSLMTYGWNKVGINYVFIFEFKPDIKRSSTRYLKYGLIFVAIWLLTINIYIAAASNSNINISSSKYLILIPIVFILGTIAFCLLPFPFIAHHTRHWVIHRISKVISAPWIPVRFPDFFMSVQLLCLGEFLFNIQSMVCMFRNYDDKMSVEEEGICSISSVVAYPILSSLPFFWRVMQCFRRYYETRQWFPHITSAIRSIFSIVTLALSYGAVQIGGTEYWNWLRIVWFIVNIIASFYKVYADFKVDWGLFMNYSTNTFWPLRKKMVFKRKWIYYLAMGNDIFLRFTWLIIFGIRKGRDYDINNPLLLWFFSLSDIAWATQFIFFRVESEHVQCADTYSHFRDIPVPFSEEYQLYMSERKDRNINKRRKNHHHHHHHSSTHNSQNPNQIENGSNTTIPVNNKQTNPIIGGGGSNSSDTDEDDTYEIDEVKELNLESNSEFQDDEEYNQRQHSLHSSIQKIASNQDLQSMARSGSHPDVNSHNYHHHTAVTHHQLNVSNSSGININMPRIKSRVELNQIPHVTQQQQLQMESAMLRIQSHPELFNANLYNGSSLVRIGSHPELNAAMRRIPPSSSSTTSASTSSRNELTSSQRNVNNTSQNHHHHHNHHVEFSPSVQQIPPTARIHTDINPATLRVAAQRPCLNLNKSK